MCKNKKGQSTLELALMMIIFLSMLTITFNAVVAFSLHQYFSYAAFMSARALQAAGENPADQKSRAVEALSRYIPGIDANLSVDKFVIPEIRGSAFAQDIRAFIVPEPGSSAPEASFPQEGGSGSRGVIIDFRVPFVVLPIGNEMRGALQYLNMQVVSYLGREPTSSECRSFFQAFFSAYGRNGNLHDDEGMEDTGC